MLKVVDLSFKKVENSIIYLKNDIYINRVSKNSTQTDLLLKFLKLAPPLDTESDAKPLLLLDCTCVHVNV